jgi:hypothetical protein
MVPALGRRRSSPGGNTSVASDMTQGRLTQDQEEDQRDREQQPEHPEKDGYEEPEQEADDGHEKGHDGGDVHELVL